MKINQEFRLTVDQGRVDQKQSFVSKGNFNEFMQFQGNKLQVEQLNKLLSEIQNSGERLAKSRTFNDLGKYKTFVKRFIQQAVDYGMGLKQSHSWNSQGNSRSLKIIERLDETLLQLTKDVIDKEKKSIDILEKVGEIKGLLINLYT